jgi:23S rRNA (guanosine2251-2'-O)-methyltransferase
MAANNRRMSGKKGAQVGSGGQRRRSLEGKGPTPPAEMRKGHAKQRAAQAKVRRATGRPGPKGRGGRSASEMVVGRNPVVEALREGVPATMLYVQQFIDNDERVREALQLAGERGGIHLMEASTTRASSSRFRRTSTRTPRTWPRPRTTRVRTR